jgi:hypothetical protein
MSFFDKRPLHPTKRWLPKLCENRRYRFFLDVLNFVIAINARETEPLRQSTAHGAFARAHKTHQIKINVFGFHRVCARGKRAPRPLPTSKMLSP